MKSKQENDRDKSMKPKVGFSKKLKLISLGTSLVAQWLRICLTMQGTWVQTLVLEDPTCCGATNPMCHNH